MSNKDIVRAWKDAEYRQSLSAEAQVHLPAHPAGAIELTDEDLSQVAGGTTLLTLCYSLEIACYTDGSECPHPATA